MNENPNKLTTVEVTQLAEIFEKTLLELSILDSLYGGSDLSGYVQNVFRASVEELHNFGTLKTLCTLTDGTAEHLQQKNKQKEEQQYRMKNEPKLRQRLVSNDKLFMLEYISSGKKLQLLKEEEEEIDSSIEKCTVSLFN